MFYEKKIKYLNYYENGIRIRGAGYVRLEARDRSLRMELTVTGLHPTDSFVRDVFLCAGKEEKSVGAISITGGRGQYRLQWPDTSDIAGTGMSYSGLQGIRIPLGMGREISCLWQEQQKKAGTKPPSPIESRTGTELPSKGAASPGLSAGSITAVDPIAGRAVHAGVTAETIAQADAVPESMTAAGLSAKTSLSAEHASGTGFTAKGGSDAILTAEKSAVPAAPTGKATSHAAPTAEAITDAGFTMKGSAGTELKAEGISHTALTAGSTGKPEPNASNAAPTFRSERTIAAERPERMLWEELRKEAGKEAAKKTSSVPDPSEIREGSRAPRDHRGEPTRLLDDKWQQLWSIYPHVRPFRDKREYLSIRPADFVIFSSPSYRLVNNSFLLHGYYNYKHLILTKVERKGETYYYIGVPGSFFEKEKQVAIMFGFESFECAEEPAQAGDFGYYMMRTEI